MIVEWKIKKAQFPKYEKNPVENEEKLCKFKSQVTFYKIFLF